MKSVLLVLSLLCASLYVNAQNYPDVLSYYQNGAPTNGIKIKTNLPFSNSGAMPTIMIEGFCYGTNETINLMINFYVFNDIFYKGVISASGGHTPPVYLAAENGMVVIFINTQNSYPRIHVRAFGMGRPNDVPASYTGWTAIDSALSSTATSTLLLPYENRFPGDVNLPGNSIWNASGNVGIGTTTPGTYKLAVEGTAAVRRLKVTQQSTWSDFVFQSDYQLPPLNEVENYINTNKHLSGIPSAVDVQKEGFDVGEMNKLLLQKVEELTLYMIEMKKEIDQLKASKK